MELSHSERFIFLIEKLSRNPSDFARKIEKSPQSITNITTGRNKAGTDILEATLLAYPQINPEWLLLGKGEALRKEEKKEDESIISMWQVLKENYDKTIEDLRYTVNLQRQIINGELGKQGANEFPRVEIIKLFPDIVGMVA